MPDQAGSWVTILTWLQLQVAMEGCCWGCFKGWVPPTGLCGVCAWRMPCLFWCVVGLLYRTLLRW
jgi:hypothetical protein